MLYLPEIKWLIDWCYSKCSSIAAFLGDPGQSTVTESELFNLLFNCCSKISYLQQHKLVSNKISVICLRCYVVIV